MNPTGWNSAIVQAAPRSGAFLQSYEWGEFQKAVGREVRRYDHDNARAQVVQYPIKSLSLRGSRATKAISLYGWTAYRAPIRENREPSHPSGDHPQGENENLVNAMVKDLKKTRGIFLHIEPATPVIPSGAEGTRTKSHQPQKTIILDLTKPEDELLAAMHEKTRYNIRLAEKHGVVVNRLDPNDPPSFITFWELMEQTAARQGFHLHERPYYSTMLRVLKGDLEDQSRASAHLYLATRDGKALAALLAISFAGTITYLHGATGDEQKNLMAPYALHWGVIRNAKSHGATSYDLWGIDETRWPGVTRFKIGFGGEVVSFPGALELPLRPFWYRMYGLARKLAQ